MSTFSLCGIMISERLKSLIAWSVIGSVMLTFMVILFVTDRSLRDNLIAAIVGSGLIGIVVGAVLLSFKETGEFEASKNKANLFYETKLLLDLREAIDLGPTPFILGQGPEFYFNGNLINAVYQVAENNLEAISNYLAYFPDNLVVDQLRKVYLLYRRATVLAKKLDDGLYQIVREHHHENEIDSFNDNNTKSYIKSKIITELPDSELERHLDWTSIPKSASQALKLVIDNIDIQEQISGVKELRDHLLLLVGELVNSSVKK